MAADKQRRQAITEEVIMDFQDATRAIDSSVAPRE
jgi:hypothetical protein